METERTEIVRVPRGGVYAEDIDTRRGRGWAIAVWSPLHSQWQCNGAHGYGYGRTPESAVQAAGWDGGIGPLVYRTRRAAERAAAAAL